MQFPGFLKGAGEGGGVFFWPFPVLWAHIYILLVQWWQEGTRNLPISCCGWRHSRTQNRQRRCTLVLSLLHAHWSDCFVFVSTVRDWRIAGTKWSCDPCRHLEIYQSISKTQNRRKLGARVICNFQKEKVKKYVK